MGVEFQANVSSVSFLTSMGVYYALFFLNSVNIQKLL